MECSSISVDHSRMFEPTAAVAKFIGRFPVSAAMSLRRLSMEPHDNVLDCKSSVDGLDIFYKTEFWFAGY